MDTITTIAPGLAARSAHATGMIMRGLLPSAQDHYVRHVRRFASFAGRLPDTAAADDLRGFHIHRHEKGAGATTINRAVSALRFLYRDASTPRTRPRPSRHAPP